MNLEKSIIKVDIVKIVDNIFRYAVERRASDIHIQPKEGGADIRLRVDGVLETADTAGLDIYKLIVNRIKVLSGIEVSGRPQPREGRIKIKVADDEYDLRVSIFPTIHGDCVVMRILEDINSFADYLDLGMSREQATILAEKIKKTYGLILVTGPTGSGKSTTIFTILNKLNVEEKSIVTLEDPVERRIDRVRQTQVDPDNGLTFANGLRYIVRQDPNIIMVGEIRDKETARIAVQAAITGHLVIASIHTNNAAGAIVRLINMGVEPFLLSSALLLVTAQRLARQLCPACRVEIEPPPAILKKINAPQGMKFYHSPGCEECAYLGTKGRIGVHELLVVDQAIRNLILSNPNDLQIVNLAEKVGMVPLKKAVLQKVHNGDISLEEALAVTEEASTI
ncbi:hypothetical protein COX69_04050 [Candidatus Falkowbacteria bacterium CG_4_10_14_0_2_um_filter_48_10]|uniref:Bacterial type II secretion system protein E domain-containing protein n=1 Tax=Candidatus Falkowbacteria bacterium CG23_combo_of_CG06-09_8_20_14_all_49_15 TaxID=1974572 RepID=A0A2G9ZKX6_9BACT|nr:MAG: hypothetical protein COX22_02420 [Candidatus Falkowbacteria bacterium CG23_combo_of_CG06-09_8_20_14_all_49_15]PJA07690.1 MAG: hypothetical protein COX69_04050 [Candidatus Falkowbacteria bacterium CG_4_10_14_0_2_um_filter_48_10]